MSVSDNRSDPEHLDDDEFWESLARGEYPVTDEQVEFADIADNWLGQLSFELGVDPQAVKPSPPRNRPAISPRERVWIFLRDGSRCIVCNGNEDLEVAHIISVAAGHRLGLSDAAIYSSENLAVMCFECNRGLGSACPPPQFVMAVWAARTNGRYNGSC